MAADQETFQQILTSLLSSENEVRTQAEKTYVEIPVKTRVVHLLNTVHNESQREEERQMATVLLRRLFSVEFGEFYTTLPPEAQQELKSRVLAILHTEQSDNLRRKACEVVAELARNLIDDDGNNIWPEFLQFLFQCANSTSPILKEASLRMFAAVPGVFGNQQVQHLDLIKQMLQQALTDASSYNVRFQAVKAVCAFIMLHEKEDTIHKHFMELLPPVIAVIAESIKEHQDDSLLKCLIDLAESAPKFLRPQTNTIIQMCLEVLSDNSLDENSWKHLALETIVTLSETAPAMMRKEAGHYIPVLIPIVLDLMTDLDDDPEWSVSDEIVEDDNDSNNVVAESALDRLACGLGGKTILPQVLQNIPNMLTHENWKYRHAALMAISAVGEGCYKQMEGMLPQIMDGVLQYLSDPHPRVRYAACNAIGQMSTDFAPTFEKKFHDKVIPGLLMVLDDNQNPRVQAHAGAALVNFSEDCPKNILVQYLNEIMAKLEGILSAKFNELVEKGTKLVLEQVVTTIASVADTSEEQFVAYYDRLMPCLKYIIQNANTPELKMLRGKTIECVSLIGLAVGKEKFAPDATEIMDLLLKTHGEGELPDDDPQTSYLISAWARICKILGKAFQPYLPLVIGPVMRTASLKPEVTLMDNDDMDEVSGDDDWQFVSLGEQQNFGIRTAGIEDKASACDMLVCYALALKEGFADYAEPVVKLMVPMLKFYFHDGVRTAAAQSLPCLLDCAKSKGTAFIQGMWEYICPELLKAIETEPETEVKHEHMRSLAMCIETLGKGCMSEESMKELLRILDTLLKQHFDRAVERLDKRKDEDYDEIVEEQLEDEDNDDNYTLGKIADILHALFFTYKQDFYPYFDMIIGHFIKMIGADQPWSDRQWSLCVFDDVIEFGGPACIKYQQYFLSPILEGVRDKNPAVRQAAAYGCGTLAMNGGPAFAATCAEALPRLADMINDPQSRAEENIGSTENAISAVTKILQHNNSNVNVNEILPHWLSWLPVWEDPDEAPHIYGYLCQLIETNNSIVIGPNSSNIPRLIAIIAEAFNRDALPYEHPVSQRLANIVRQIQGSGEMFQLCVNQLSSEQQVALHDLLSSNK
ncbi:importin-5 [Halyomorpha halys]|uniref:importin-5 n=1 Tax=Halyomorpha halys TaxID=286706 RepID=UPI0006D4E16F|nr:importin-5 [Halyomorpha halys]